MMENSIPATDDNAIMPGDDQLERGGLPSENISSQRFPTGSETIDENATVATKRTHEGEKSCDFSTAAKLLKKATEGEGLLGAYQFSTRQTRDGEDNPTPVSSPTSTLTLPFKRSDSEEDLNDEEVALLMAAPPKMQGNESEKNSPSGEQDSGPATSDEGSAGSEQNVSSKNEDTNE